MSGISPNYADWRQLSAIPIWKVASLMQGFDPRAVEAGDVVVQDPFEPSSPYGVGPDFSWEIEVLISAVQTADLVSVPATITRPKKNTKITKASLIPWLRANDYADLANGLDVAPLEECAPSSATVVLSGRNVPVSANRESGQTISPTLPAKEGGQNGPVFSVKKSVLIDKYKKEWPTIERDLQDACDNGLSACKAGARDWIEDCAKAWAQSRGKLSPVSTSATLGNSMNDIVGRKHILGG